MRRLIEILLLCAAMLVSSGALAQRVLVIGYDGLGCGDAQNLIDDNRVVALKRLETVYCNLSLGMSVTQTGWAATWTGLPPLWINNELVGALGNNAYSGFTRHVHLLERIMDDNPTLYVGWILAKGFNVRGNIPDSPHYGVYSNLVLEGHPGVYRGDQLLSNAQVFSEASAALTGAGSGPTVVFALFRYPDAAGHQDRNLASYLDTAVEVDGYAEQLIVQAKAAAPTMVVLISDHAFGFLERGDPITGHITEDKGFLGFDFPTTGVGESSLTVNGTPMLAPVVNQGTFPRFLAELFGYDPDFLTLPDEPEFGYKMHGVSVGW